MRSDDIRLDAGEVALEGMMTLPREPSGIVLFTHGRGSSRHVPSDRLVAGVLNDGGIGTLLFDLLTPEESALDEQTGELRFDSGLLGGRLIGALEWLAAHHELGDLPVGLFGVSTGAAAALIAAAKCPEQVDAVVSRGGRPDLAMVVLPRVRAPTLLIVGGLDGPAIGMNQRAAAELGAEHRLEIVPGATHLFEEPGKLEQVARLACDWFQGYFVVTTRRWRHTATAGLGADSTRSK